jgi:hypothetical protein
LRVEKAVMNCELSRLFGRLRKAAKYLFQDSLEADVDSHFPIGNFPVSKIVMEAMEAW